MTTTYTLQYIVTCEPHDPDYPLHVHTAVFVDPAKARSWATERMDVRADDPAPTWREGATDDTPDGEEHTAWSCEYDDCDWTVQPVCLVTEG